MKCKLKKDVTTKSGEVIPQGTECDITVERNRPTTAFLQIEGREKKIAVPCVGLCKLFNEFPEYHMSDIEAAMEDGTCPSMTGDDVEPDGWDSEGFPSLLMAAGLM